MSRRSVSVRELVDAGSLVVSDGYRTKRSEHGQPGFRIIRVADVFDDAVRLDSPDFVSEDFRHEIGTKLGQAGDILLTTKGTVGRVAILPNTPEPVVYSPQLCFFRVADESVISPRYLRYWFGSPPFSAQADDRMNNTDMAAYINLADIRSLIIELPPVETQRAIAEVLGALDDKIAANTKLLCSIDDLLAAGFARLMERAEGEAVLGALADINAESVKPTDGGMLRYVDIAAVGVGRYEHPERSDWSDAPGRARRRIRRGDTLWSTVRPNRRSHALNLSNDPELVGSTGLAVLSPRVVGFAYLYEATRLPEFTAYLESSAEGSAYPAVRADRFAGAPVPLLSRPDRDRFEAQAAPMRELADSFESESRRLAAMRDALLPQLMSGAIRVKDAVRVAEAAL